MTMDPRIADQEPIPADQYEETIARALRANAGMRSLTATALKIKVDALNRYIAASPYLTETLARIEDLSLDRAELALLNAIQGVYEEDVQPDGTTISRLVIPPQRWAIEYYLNHKGRRRGYGHLTPGAAPPPGMGQQVLPSHIRDVIQYDDGALDLACKLAERTANRQPLQLPAHASRDGSVP